MWRTSYLVHKWENRIYPRQFQNFLSLFELATHFMFDIMAIRPGIPYNENKLGFKLLAQRKALQKGRWQTTWNIVCFIYVCKETNMSTERHLSISTEKLLLCFQGSLSFQSGGLRFVCISLWSPWCFTMHVFKVKKMLGQCEEIFPSATSVIILESAELKRLILELTQLTGQMISRISCEYYGISKIVDL